MNPMKFLSKKNNYYIEKSLDIECDSEYTYVFYLVNDLFLDGLLTLIWSLKKNKTKYPFVCMITEQVSVGAKNSVLDLGVTIIELKQNDLIYSQRTDFTDRYKNDSWMMFSKLNIFRLTKFKKVVYLDCDIICLDNCDELFDFKAPAFYHDPKALDIHNRGISAGVMVIQPDLGILNSILKNINTKKYGGHTDQSLLQFFYRNNYNPLPEKYNLLYKVIKRENRIEVITNKDDAKLLHFNGQKPWISAEEEMGWEGEKDIAYELYHSIQKDVN